MAGEQSDVAQLVIESGDSLTKCRKIPFILAGVFAALAAALLVTTIVLALQKNELAAEVDKFKGIFKIKGNNTKHQTEEIPTAKPPPLCVLKQCNDSASVYKNNMNMNRDPCVDFFEYACGGWTKTHRVPPDKMGFSTFEALGDELENRLKGIIERDEQAKDPVSYQIVKDFYKSCTDLDIINNLGAAPLVVELESLGGWPVLGTSPGGHWNQRAFNLEDLWAKIRGQYGINVIFATGVLRDPITNLGYKIQAYESDDFGLVDVNSKRKRKPNKDLFSLIDEENKDNYGPKMLLEDEFSELKKAYLQFMVDVAVALGADEPTARQDMNDVMEFETHLIYLSVRYEADDLPKTSTLQEIGMDQIDWVRLYQSMMSGTYISRYESILNWRPNFIRQATVWLKTQSARVKANYMIWRFVNNMVPFLNDPFLGIEQKLNKVVLGTSPSDRWKTCVRNANSMYEFVTGRMYVDDHFPEYTTIEIQEMINNLRKAFKSMVATSYWLLFADRTAVEAKIDAMQIAIGYPNWLKLNSLLDDKYKNVTARPTEYFKNRLRYMKWVSKNELALIRQHVTKDMWSVSSPAVVNAFYSPWINGVVYPAGILQPPLYHKDLPWYSNYGGIGVVLGHELTHGFDNDGRRYDKYGSYRVWWSQSSIDRFVTKAQCIVDQYSSFVMPENHKHLKGKNTLNEDIADNGGVKISYKAYKDNIIKQPRLPGIDLTGEQMFFVSFAQTWCSVLTSKGADSSIDLSSHSPGRYRVIGTLQNNVAFRTAFNCPRGSRMDPVHKCTVWALHEAF